MDENGVNGLMFTQESDAITQFMRETASDPYFVRYNRFDNVLAKLKATATSSIVLDENGNVVSDVYKRQVLKSWCCLTAMAAIPIC